MKREEFKGIAVLLPNMLCMNFTLLCILLALPSVVKQEKVHQNLLEGVEHFDKATMKPTQTQEKNPLPDPEGRWHGGGLETC